MFGRRQWRKLHTNCLQTCSAIRVWRQQSYSSNLWGDNYVSYILIKTCSGGDSNFLTTVHNLAMCLTLFPCTWRIIGKQFYSECRAVQKENDGLMPLLWNNQQSFDFPNLIFEHASAAKGRHLWNHLPSFDFPNHVSKNMPLRQNAVIWKVIATFKTWL